MGLRSLLRFDYRYFAKGTFWLGLLRAVSAGSSFLLSILYARFLSKEQFGDFRFVISFAGILASLSLTGIGTALISTVTRGYEGTAAQALAHQLRWGRLLIAIGLGTCGWAIYKQNWPLTWSLAFVTLCVPIGTSFIIYESVLKGRGEFKTLTWYGLAYKLSRDISLALVTITIGGQLIPLSVAAYLIPTALTVYLYYQVDRSIPPEKRTVEEGTVLYGSRLSYIRFFTLGLNHIDSLITFALFGPSVLALYSFVKVIPESLGSFISLVQPMILAKFATRRHDDAKKSVYKGIVLLGAGTLVVAALYILCAPWLFRTFYPNYMEAVKLSQIYILKFITTPVFLVGLYLHSQHRTRLTVGFGIIKVALGYLSLLLFVYFRTIETMVYLRVIAEWIFAALSLIVFSLSENTPPSKQAHQSP